MTSKIFYSWQSDLPNSTNRGFIGKALEQAVRNIRSDASIEVEPVIDRDIQDVPGSPNIAETIFTKINNSEAFVADVSIIHTNKSIQRATPNPNILIELGYAMGQLGSERILMVQNLAYGTPEMLPFDLKLNHVLAYNILESNKEKARERKMLSSRLEKALRLILDQDNSRSLSEKSVLAWYEVMKLLRNGQIKSQHLDDPITDAVVHQIGRYRLSVSREDELSNLKDEFTELYNIYSKSGNYS